MGTNLMQKPQIPPQKWGPDSGGFPHLSKFCFTCFSCINLPKRKVMTREINGYQVTNEANVADVPWKMPANLEKEVVELHYQSQEGKLGVRKRIELLIEQHPDVPMLRNFLAVWHHANGLHTIGEEINEETHNIFPTYIFSLSQKVQKLAEQGKLEEAGALLHGKSNIEDLYPERKIFHISEYSMFHFGLVFYLLASYRFEEAEEKIELLRKVDVDDDVLTKIDRAKLRYMFEKNRKWRDECEEKEVTAIRRSEMTVSQREVSIAHAELQFDFLDCNLWEMDTEALRDAIETNKEDLLAELNKILVYAVEGFKHIKQHDDWSAAVLHAILILSYIDDEASFPSTLLLLRQPDECVDYWTGDYLHSSLKGYFRNYSESKLKQIVEFVQESPGNTHTKNALLCLLRDFAVNTPECRTAILEAIKAIFTYFIANRDNEELFDTDVLAFAVSAAVDLRGTELLADIEELYEKD